MSKENYLEIAQIAVKAIDSKRGDDIEVIKVSDITVLTDYFVIATANTNTQLKAIADEVEYKLKEMMGYDYAILGNHDFDYKDSVLEQMLEDSRLKWLSSNYFFKNDVLASKFAPYDIREV